MKKFLSLLFLSFGLVQFSHAQVVELIGIGVKDVSSPILYIPDPGSVDHVVVEAAGVFRTYRGEPEPTDVQFYDSDETPAPSVFIEAVVQKTVPIPEQKWGHYTATFNTVDAGGITLNNVGQEAYIVSFTAYVYRTGGAGTYSEAKGDRAFLYQNGSGDPVVYNFTIPYSYSSRNVVVSVPFSDVNADGRYSIIDVTAGAVSAHAEFDDNNMGERLHIETVTVADVPGDVTEVSVSIYSPNRNLGDSKEGDSFLTSAVVLATSYDQGCNLTQGYWKTHADPSKKKYDSTWELLPSGPATVFFLSGQTWLEVFDTQPRGNAYYILAHQYMAAELNVLNGSYASSQIVTAIVDASSLFNTYSPADIVALEGGDALRDQFITLGELLDDYNNGELGPVHCGDDSESEKSAVLDNSLEINELSVYPNPIRGHATLSFNPVFDGNATVDVFNSLGQKTLTLFNQSVVKGVPVSFTFSSGQLKEGLYVITLQNGMSRESMKVQIK
ncbi:T9SS type A sorting domain-containing protein [Maribellus maritimus]|uniref:T9SS type A sorting domain-containing protein n=1 Tax=Maribellus maritimus TaxID=2870838 RepID=UPI001EECB73E|nr:T9SS type A sorting domain-containing protein [Maribellus maritimus]MCG6190236.1 T9SS type A sorting domain-containing protein [Maribellus maritimus]